MPRIKNWERIIGGRYPAWQNKISNKVIIVSHDPDWDGDTWLAELYAKYEHFHETIIGKNIVDIIGYYNCRSSMMRRVIWWMRKHPMG